MSTLLKIETAKHPRFAYDRFQFFSNQLGLNVHFGRALPDGVSDAQGTIYVLHGGNGDDKQTIEAGLLETLSEKTINSLIQNKIQIVLPWVGATFLSSKTPISHLDYESYFLKELLPLAEPNLRSSPTGRYICGYSMGGQASFNFCMRHPELFQGVGGIFPTFVSFNPFEPHELQDFSARNNIQNPWLDVLKLGFVDNFENAKHFHSHDPLSLLANNNKSLLLKKIYIGVGGKDQFGLHEGCQVFSKKLSDLKIAHKFELNNDGEHGAPVLKEQFPKMIEALLGLS